jgi:iron(III) transport system ATP-binding protein
VLKVSALYTEYTNELGQAVKAAQDISFEVPKGEFFTLLGPSGCGKTTTLRSIAGLERPRAGEIGVDDTVFYSSQKNVFVQPNRRGFGMVFQSYAIWPHMDVFGNAAFPLQVGKKSYSKAEIDQKVMRVLKAVQLDQLRDREATKLSGGQQQRLALARALVMEPKLLLLDEPLSNLDAKLRDAMRFELKRLQRELRITTVYVTHDQSEALALSHKIAVMSEGRIQQIGTPREVYDRPLNKFVADFVGTTNFIDGTVAARGAGENAYLVETEIGPIQSIAVDELRVGDRVVLSIRLEDLELSERKPDCVNLLQGTVHQKVFLGDNLEFQVKFGERVLQARVHPSLGTRVGEPIWGWVQPEKSVVVRADQEMKNS